MKLSFKILSLCFVACLLVFCTNAKVMTDVPLRIKLNDRDAFQKYSAIAGHESHSHNDVLVVCLGSTSSVSGGVDINIDGVYGGGGIGVSSSTQNTIANCYIFSDISGQHHTHIINKNDDTTLRIEASCARQDLLMYADADVTDNRSYQKSLFYSEYFLTTP